ECRIGARGRIERRVFFVQEFQRSSLLRIASLGLSGARARFRVKPPGSPENGSDRFAIERLCNPCTGDSVAQNRKDFAVRAQRRFYVVIRVGERYVVKPTPEDPALDELLLNERLLKERIGSRGVESHHGTAVEPDAPGEFHSETPCDI